MYRVPKNTSGVSDAIAALQSGGLVFLLSWQDVRQRYRRSIIGPFWITISNAILIGVIGFIFGKIFSADPEFIASLAIGLTLWTLVSSCIIEGCSSFIVAEQIIKQLPIPLFVHIERVVMRNLFIFAHNAVIIPLVLVFAGNKWSWVVFVSLIGFCLLIANLLWIVLLAAILCTRYRDLPQIIANAIQVVFYVTPIVWVPAVLGANSWLLQANPFYHLLELVRMPLLAHWPSVPNWTVSSLLAVFGWSFTLFLFNRYRRRVAYWL